MSGMPLGSVRMAPSCSTTQPPISQSQCSQPLANGQRPLTRSAVLGDGAAARGEDAAGDRGQRP